MKKYNKLSIEELLKPTTMTCCGCGGVLHVIPYRDGKQVKTMNICGKCSFTTNIKENESLSKVQHSTQ